MSSKKKRRKEKLSFEFKVCLLLSVCIRKDLHICTNEKGAFMRMYVGRRA